MAKTSTETPIFYTEATFVEYHRLLVNLLEHFKLHLCALVKDPWRRNDSCLRVDKVRFFGSTLHNMVYSQIMERHLQNIEDLLAQAMNQKQEKAGQNDQTAAKADVAATKGGREGAGLGGKFGFLGGKKKEAGDGGEGKEAKDEELDESIASVRIEAIEYLSHCSNQEPVRDSKSAGSRCSQWLRLMTTYFDAMDQLLSLDKTSPRLPINTKVQVLAVEHQGKKRMDWEWCIKHLPYSQVYPNGDDLVNAFKFRLKDDAQLNSWFDHAKGTFRDDNFPGTVHCEAIASVLLRLQRQGSINFLPVSSLLNAYFISLKTFFNRRWKTCSASPKDAAPCVHF